mgnify:CR=1 FL=1
MSLSSSAFFAALLASLQRLFAGAEELVAHAEGVVQLEGVHGLLEGEDGLLGFGGDLRAGAPAGMQPVR